MNLVVDIGNTRLKYGIFSENTLINEGFVTSGEKIDISQLLNKYIIKNSIICSVTEHTNGIEDQLKANTNYIHFTSETPVPVKNLYKTKNTLGSDRLAVAIGASAQFPGSNILAIDTGTCIKYNFITAQNEYLGGGISPGIDMRLKALNSFTDKLPLIKSDYSYDILIGKTTEHSILSGVMNGAVLEVQGIIEEYIKQYSSVKTVITGGNHTFFAKRLKNSIFADPFLLLKGLNAIIEFNVH